MTFWWQTFFRPKKNPERDLKALVEALRTALCEELKSVVLFGSLAANEFHPAHSNVNVLVMADASSDTFEQMAPALKPWLARGHVPPILVQPDELDGFARAFPIEFLDMQDHHRVLAGDDPLARLTVDRQHLRAQVEHDLSLLKLKVRQALAAGDTRQLRRTLAESVPSAQTLLSAAVRWVENAPPLDKIVAAERLAERLSINPAVLRRLRDLRQHHEAGDLKELASQYLDLIGAVLRHLRK